MRGLRKRHGRGRATLASAGTFARPGQVVRYVGNQPQLAGMEGRVVHHHGHDVRVQWAAHEGAIRQRGSVAHWADEDVSDTDLKPIRKLTKGFAFYHREMQDGHHVWVRSAS